MLIAAGRPVAAGGENGGGPIQYVVNERLTSGARDTDGNVQLIRR